MLCLTSPVGNRKMGAAMRARRRGKRRWGAGRDAQALAGYPSLANHLGSTKDT